MFLLRYIVKNPIKMYQHVGDTQYIGIRTNSKLDMQIILGILTFFQLYLILFLLLYYIIDDFFYNAYIEGMINISILNDDLQL